ASFLRPHRSTKLAVRSAIETNVFANSRQIPGLPRRACAVSRAVFRAYAPVPMRYDVCVLGAGPGGYAPGMRAPALGKKVALVERRRVGGAGIHAGALSSKTMWHLSNDYSLARRIDRGFRARDVEVSYPAVIDTVKSAVAERRGALLRQIEVLAKP